MLFTCAAVHISPQLSKHILCLQSALVRQRIVKSYRDAVNMIIKVMSIHSEVASNLRLGGRTSVDHVIHSWGRGLNCSWARGPRKKCTVRILILNISPCQSYGKARPGPLADDSLIFFSHATLGAG